MEVLRTRAVIPRNVQDPSSHPVEVWSPAISKIHVGLSHKEVMPLGGYCISSERETELGGREGRIEISAW